MSCLQNATETDKAGTYRDKGKVFHNNNVSRYRSIHCCHREVDDELEAAAMVRESFADSAQHVCSASLCCANYKRLCP